jgi:hypothetical protein
MVWPLLLFFLTAAFGIPLQATADPLPPVTTS